MEPVHIRDKHFKLFIGRDEIQQRISHMAQQIEQDYSGKQPIFLCLLKGSFIFAADLFRAVNMPAEVSFVRLNSYDGTNSTGEVNTLLAINDILQDRHVILVEDIIDTGKTVHELMKELEYLQPASVKLASLLSKPDALQHDVTIDYTGFVIPDKFVVGYGMDYNELGRNLPDIYVLADQED